MNESKQWFNIINLEISHHDWYKFKEPNTPNINSRNQTRLPDTIFKILTAFTNKPYIYKKKHYCSSFLIYQMLKIARGSLRVHQHWQGFKYPVMLGHSGKVCCHLQMAWPVTSLDVAWRHLAVKNVMVTIILVKNVILGNYVFHIRKNIYFFIMLLRQTATGIDLISK